MHVGTQLYMHSNNRRNTKCLLWYLIAIKSVSIRRCLCRCRSRVRRLPYRWVVKRRFTSLPPSKKTVSNSWTSQTPKSHMLQWAIMKCKVWLTASGTFCLKWNVSLNFINLKNITYFEKCVYCKISTFNLHWFYQTKLSWQLLMICNTFFKTENSEAKLWCEKLIVFYNYIAHTCIQAYCISHLVMTLHGYFEPLKFIGVMESYGLWVPAGHGLDPTSVNSFVNSVCTKCQFLFWKTEFITPSIGFYENFKR